MREIRRHPRIESRLRCWCEGENITVYARVGNLSEGGLFLRTNTPLQEGSRAMIRLKDTEVEEFVASVTVIWTSDGSGSVPPGMGLRFEPLDEKSLELLRRIIIGEQQAARSVG